MKRTLLDVPFAFQCGLLHEAAPTCYNTTMVNVVYLIGVEQHVYTLRSDGKVTFVRH